MPEDQGQPTSTPRDENHLPRELVDPEVLAHLAAIEQEGLVSRRLNAAMADGVLSMAEQTIGNIAAASVARGDVDPLLAAILSDPTSRGSL